MAKGAEDLPLTQKVLLCSWFVDMHQRQPRVFSDAITGPTWCSIHLVVNGRRSPILQCFPIDSAVSPTGKDTPSTKVKACEASSRSNDGPRNVQCPRENLF